MAAWGERDDSSPTFSHSSSTQVAFHRETGATELTAWEHSLIGFIITSQSKTELWLRIKASFFFFETVLFLSNNYQRCHWEKPTWVKPSVWVGGRDFSSGKPKEEFISTTNTFVLIFWNELFLQQNNYYVILSQNYRLSTKGFSVLNIIKTKTKTFP